MSPSDMELVTLAKAAQNEQAFATLVRRHQAPLRAFLLRLCSQGARADDIAQDTFLKAHGALENFRGGGSFRSWLFAIAYREFLQDARKVKSSARLEDALKLQLESDDKTAPDAGLSMDLRRALSMLGEKERASILLCDAAGFSHSEAAAAIGAPLGSIKTYVARAREQLREHLSGETTAAPETSTPSTMKGKEHAV